MDNINKNTNMSEEEYLRKHLENIDNNNSYVFDNNDLENKTGFSEEKVSNLSYFNFDIKELPCGNFYPDGTLLVVRPARVKEIQAYSMVDDNNFYDVVEKMNDMLQACVRLKYPNGKIASYLDIKDQDRIYLIFLIRELTFQQNNILPITTKCSCGTDVDIELKRKNFVFYEMDEKLKNFFDNSTKSFKFTLKNGKSYELTLPTIGLQKSFTEYIIEENRNKRPINLAFLKIIPFMLNGRNNITQEGIKAKLKEFENMDDISFQFLNATINKMLFGIKELKTSCPSCGLEVRSEMTFPNGASGIFIVHDAFETYIKK